MIIHRNSERQVFNPHFAALKRRKNHSLQRTYKQPLAKSLIKRRFILLKRRKNLLKRRFVPIKTAFRCKETKKGEIFFSILSENMVNELHRCGVFKQGFGGLTAYNQNTV